MVSVWWLYFVLAATAFAAAVTTRVAYRQGVVDGAFNHDLERVRKEMLRYNRVRAEAIFREEQNTPPGMYRVR